MVILLMLMAILLLRPHPHSRCTQSKHSLSGHSAPVLCLHVFGDRAISGSADHSVRVWDLHSRKCVRTISSHAGSVTSLAYVESGGVLFSADDRGVLCLQQLNGEHTRVLCEPDVHRGAFRALHHDATQQRLWSVSARGAVSLWDVRAPRADVRQFQSAGGELRSLTYSAYCDLVATGGEDSVVRLFDPGSGGVVRELSHRLAGWQNTGNSALYADRHHMVAFGTDGFMRVYDVHTGVCERSVHCVPEGVHGPLSAEVTAHQLVTAGADASVRVWAFGHEASLRLSKLTSVQLAASSLHLASSLEEVAGTAPLVASLSPAITSHRRHSRASKRK
jgi:WD40 repeat protein